MGSSAGMTAAANQGDVYGAFLEFERVQNEEGADAAIAYLMALPEPMRTELYTGLTSVTEVEEASTTEYLGSMQIAASADGSVMSVRCWSRTDSRLSESSVFKANLYRYFVRTTWCGNGSVITSSSQAAWRERYNVIWNFLGNAYVGSIWAGCNGCGFVQLQSQGIFQSNVAGLPFQERSPWIRTAGWPNGMSVSSQGG